MYFNLVGTLLVPVFEWLKTKACSSVFSALGAALLPASPGPVGLCKVGLYGLLGQEHLSALGQSLSAVMLIPPETLR